MQLPLRLATFEYQNKLPIRTVTIDGEPWFYALDVCGALGIKNPSDALSRLEPDERRTLGSAESSVPASRTNPSIISESGLYNVVFQSRTDDAKTFRKWVTKEVLPQIRKTGGFGRPNLHVFVRRFNDNWDRVDAGHFSVISELYIRVYGKFEHLGHRLAEKAPNGTEVRPDVSVGKTFPTFLKEMHPHLVGLFKMYRHLLPDGSECDARQYEVAALPAFIEFIETEWLPHHAETYLRPRDPVALEYLPRLLTAPNPTATSTFDVGRSKLRQMAQQIEKNIAVAGVK